jgi:hypothetical protein
MNPTRVIIWEKKKKKKREEKGEESTRQIDQSCMNKLDTKQHEY